MNTELAAQLGLLCTAVATGSQALDQYRAAQARQASVHEFHRSMADFVERTEQRQRRVGRDSNRKRMTEFGAEVQSQVLVLAETMARIEQRFPLRPSPSPAVVVSFLAPQLRSTLGA